MFLLQRRQEEKRRGAVGAPSGAAGWMPSSAERRTTLEQHRPSDAGAVLSGLPSAAVRGDLPLAAAVLRWQSGEIRTVASSAWLHPSTAAVPQRAVSFLSVVGCGTWPSSGIRQNRR
jgi:hypothetical protein